jgi:methylated-DNA-[protein]-cysteine S-methyltransferase
LELFVEGEIVMNTVWFTQMASPVGPLTLTSDGENLVGIEFDGDCRARPEAWIRDDARLAFARTQLEEYFAGRRIAFDLPYALHGTPFQLRVWRALVEVPFGATASYGQIARRIGAPTASRAVGAANGQNPLPIVVPCHRIIGQDGSLTGYGGGMHRKRWLLDLERGDPTHARPEAHLA